MSIYKRWIEDKIKRTPNRTFINATEGGAEIKGAHILTLQEVVQSLGEKSNIKFFLKIFNDISEG